MTWRKKNLAVEEWAPLQDAFGKLQLAMGGAESLAMFARSIPGAHFDEIYMTGEGIEAIESLSPGDWQNSSAPEGDGVGLLVGTANAWEVFGIDRNS